MSYFSTRFKELRKSSGLSQAALAEALGVSKSSINMYERGDREPSFETLEAIADHFNISMGDLIGKDSQVDFNSQLQVETRLIENLLDNWKNPIVKQKIVDLVHEIAQFSRFSGDIASNLYLIPNDCKRREYEILETFNYSRLAHASAAKISQKAAEAAIAIQQDIITAYYEESKERTQIERENSEKSDQSEQ